MKLVETPIKSNLDLESFYPNVTNYIFGKKAIKFYKLYSLNHLSVIYVDTFDKINLLMIGNKKKIKKQEIDYVIKNLLHTTREEVDIYLDLKKELVANGVLLGEKKKDILLIQKKEELTE